MKRFGFAMVAVALAIAAVLVWWSVRSGSDITRSGDTKLRLQLQWFDQAQFMGFYVAAFGDAYAKQGLVVDVVPGGFTVNPIQRVLLGDAEIGIATGDQVLIARANGQPLKAIGTVFNTSVACFMAREADGIRTPRDFVGKRVGVYRGFDTENVLLSMLKAEGIAPEKVEIVDAGVLEAFVQGQLDVFPSYRFNEPLKIEQRGFPIEIIGPEASNVRFYSDTLFTTVEYWEHNQDVLKRFLRGSAEGWRRSKNEPEKALDLMYQNVTNMVEGSSRPHQREMLAEALRYIGDGNENIPFYMDRSRWAAMEESLMAIGKGSSVSCVGGHCVRAAG